MSIGKLLLILCLCVIFIVASGCETIVTEQVQVEEDEDTVVVYFEPDSAVLSTDTKSALSALSTSILQRMDTIESVQIIGHAANAGTSAGRIRVAATRGKTVVRYLAELGIPASLLITEGRGADEPAASNATSEGRILNRRVEILVCTEIRNNR